MQLHYYNTLLFKNIKINNTFLNKNEIFKIFNKKFNF